MLTPLGHQLLARHVRWEPHGGPAIETPAVALPLIEDLGLSPTSASFDQHPIWLAPPGHGAGHFTDHGAPIGLGPGSNSISELVSDSGSGSGLEAGSGPGLVQGPGPLGDSPWAGATLMGDKGEYLAALPPWEPAPLAQRQTVLSPRIAIFEGAVIWLERPRELVRRLLALRSQAGPDRLVYAPGAPVESWPLLVYLGVDLFDGQNPLSAALRRELVLPPGHFPMTRVGDLAGLCSCRGCSMDGSLAERVLGHNLTHATEQTARLRRVLEGGPFRELVEAACHPYPAYVAALRLADEDHAEGFAGEVPRVPGPSLRPTSQLGFNRPEVRYWRQRIRQYRPPPPASVLLLLPCSARKPYLASKSHQLFRRELRECSRPWRVHEVSLTSPLGLVPRELERCYPAAHYDLPVTGHWNYEEREMARRQLRGLLRMGEYMEVISHLGDQHHILADLIPKAEVTVPDGERVTSQTALTRLRKALARATRGLPPITSRERLTADTLGLARFQLGAGPANHLTRGCAVKGRVERPRLVDREGVQLAMVNPDRGWLSLTLEGGQRLLRAGGPSIEVGDFQLKGDIFAGGVKSVKGIFQPGDEVVLVRDGEVVGVGVAQISSILMGQSRRGRVVKVRHRG